MKNKFTLFAVVAIFCVVLGVWAQQKWWSPHPKKEVVLLNGTMLPYPRTISAFHLTDMNEKAFDNKRFQGHWSWVFFGFTSCPRVCPVTLTTLRDAYTLFDREHAAERPKVVFISVDPERDTNARMKEYLAHFNSSFLGATGSVAQLNALTQEMSAMYTKVTLPGEKKDGKHYTINHSGTLMLMNPNGKLAAIFTPPIITGKIVADFNAILEQFHD